MKKSKILVTGGAGFIGRRLVNVLVTSGWEVVVLDDFSTGDRAALSGLDCVIVEGCITDYEDVKGAAVGVDVVLHLAAVVGIQEADDNPERLRSVNLMGVENVRLAASSLGVKKVIFASSAAVYGESKKPFQKESDPLMPQGLYGESKLAGEETLRLLQGSGTDVIVLRFFNVFGPGQKQGGAIFRSDPGVHREGDEGGRDSDFRRWLSDARFYLCG